MVLERNGRNYGDHRLVGDFGDSFFHKTELDKSLDMAWSDGCPVALRLTSPPEKGGRGASIMLQRYAEINFWAGMILKTLNRSSNDSLSKKFFESRKRTDDELLGDIDMDWIPNELKTHLLVSPELYSLPRIVVVHINSGFLLEEKQRKTFEVLDALEYSRKTSSNIKEYMIRVVEYLVSHGGNTLLLLKNMFPQGKISEDRCLEEYEKTMKLMKHISPDLFKTLKHISTEEKERVGMFPYMF